MKGDVHYLPSQDERWRRINDFINDAVRMSYDAYRAANLPIGSGKVEGSRKFVVGKRFKGSGMRWKKADNGTVLRARLAKINGYLEPHCRPQPQKYTFLSAQRAA